MYIQQQGNQKMWKYLHRIGITLWPSAFLAMLLATFNDPTPAPNTLGLIFLVVSMGGLILHIYAASKRTE